MQRSKKYLYDIIVGGERIAEELSGVSIETYSKDWKKQNIVEREIEKIAEAGHKLRIKHDIRLANADRVYNFRNSVIHQYDEIKPETVFQFSINVLPLLVEEAKLI